MRKGALQQMANRSRGFYWKLALTNLRNNRRVYLPYILSSIGIAMMFYIMCALGPGIDQENMYGCLLYTSPSPRDTR